MKLKAKITGIALFVSIFCLQAQNLEVTHLIDGSTTMVPLQSIDSVSFDLNNSPQLLKIYQSNSNIISKNLAEIDSITYQTNPIISEYALTTFFCGTPTEIVDVINPATGKTWMDRNLGASQAATSTTDVASYGDLYQWGRGADGHQCRYTRTTSTLSSTDQPRHNDFITINSGNYDWRSPQNNNLWQGVNGVNNPCPSGYRIPTEAELNAERLSWNSNNNTGAFASPLKLPMAGGRNNINGSLGNFGTLGGYWSSTVSSFGTNSRFLAFAASGSNMNTINRARGYSVRCLKD